MNKNAQPQTQLFLSDYYSRAEREWVKHIVQPEIDYFFANSGGWMEALLSFVILLFIFYEIGRLCPYLRRTAKVWRTLTLFLIAFIYSFMSGAFFSHFFGQKYLERSDYLIEFYQNNVFPHNPTYLIDEGEYMYFAHLLRPLDTALADSVQKRRLTMKTILSQDTLLSRHRNSVMLEVLKTVYPRHSSGRYNWEKEGKGALFSRSEILQVSLFKNILIQFTFFAMFIGIFLQLIFDERPITQPI